MKATLAILALAATTAGAQAAMIAFWKQDELSGNLIDSTGNHPAGVSAVAPTYGAPGVPNGTYGSIVISNAAGTSIDYGPANSDEAFIIGADNNNPVMNLDRTGSFTVMGWINPSAPTVTQSYSLITTGTPAGSGNGWGFSLRLNGTTGAGSAVRFTGYGVADNDSNTTFQVNFGQWIHLAVTYSNGTINYYLNGDLLGGGPDNSLFTNEAPEGRLTIGSRSTLNDLDQVNGRLDGLRVYDTVLSLNEIRAGAIESVSIPEPVSVASALAALGAMALVRRRR